MWSGRFLPGKEIGGRVNADIFSILTNGLQRVVQADVSDYFGYLWQFAFGEGGKGLAEDSYFLEQLANERYLLLEIGVEEEVVDGWEMVQKVVD